MPHIRPPAFVSAFIRSRLSRMAWFGSIPAGGKTSEWVYFICKWSFPQFEARRQQFFRLNGDNGNRRWAASSVNVHTRLAFVNGMDLRPNAVIKLCALRAFRYRINRYGWLVGEPTKTLSILMLTGPWIMVNVQCICMRCDFDEADAHDVLSK